MNIDKIFEQFSKEMAAARSQTQMTLQGLIDALEAMAPYTQIDGISAECDSYRGYYRDLAFEPGICTAGELLAAAKEAVGKTFQGYKGGDYTMTPFTPVWVSGYGSCGPRLMTIVEEGSGYKAVTEEEDE